MLLSLQAIQSAAFAVGVFGGVHDLLTRRIPNWLTFPSMLLGILAQAALAGGAGAANGLAGIGLGFALFFPVYATGHMGAGDVKLQMAVGAWLGWWLALHVAGGAILLGGTFALGEVLLRGRIGAVVRNAYRFLRSVTVPGLEREPLRVDESRKFAFGACIAGAVGFVIFLQNSGRLS